MKGLAATLGSAALVLTAVSATGASRAIGPVSIDFPSGGNVTLVQFGVSTRSAALGRRLPRVRVAAPGVARQSFFAVSSTVRTAHRGIVVLLAVIRPSPGNAPSSQPLGKLDLSLPNGYVPSEPRIARNILYVNSLPSFRIEVPINARVVAGAAPAKVDPLRVLLDARALALEQAVDTSSMEPLGLPFVNVRLQRNPLEPAHYTATMTLISLNQVNAVELGFPVQVVGGHAAQTGTQLVAGGRTLQFTSSQSAFIENVQYRFTFNLASKPSPGSTFTVRASTHYFENTLPFSERFFLPSR
jgi:hypothetical protein